MTESNLYSLRFSQIAKRAGVPQALMDYHFPSQEALLRDMVDAELEKFLLAVIEALEKNVKNPRKALEAYIRVCLNLQKRMRASARCGRPLPPNFGVATIRGFESSRAKAWV